MVVLCRTMVASRVCWCASGSLFREHARRVICKSESFALWIKPWYSSRGAWNTKSHARTDRHLGLSYIFFCAHGLLFDRYTQLSMTMQTEPSGRQISMLICTKTFTTSTCSFLNTSGKGATRSTIGWWQGSIPQLLRKLSSLPIDLSHLAPRNVYVSSSTTVTNEAISQLDLDGMEEWESALI